MPSDQEAAQVQQLIAALREVAGHDASRQANEPHINGWDEAPAGNGAGQEAEAVAQ